MNSKLAWCVSALVDSHESTDDLFDEISRLLQQQHDLSIDSLLRLHQWVWTSFSRSYHSSSYERLIRTVTSFDKKLIFDHDGINFETKLSLLFSFTAEQMEHIFNRIDQCQNDDDPFISLFSAFFDNLIHLLNENPGQEKLSIMDYLDEYIITHYLLSDRYKTYLGELRQVEICSTLFTARFMFYIRTCSFYIRASLTTDMCHSGTRLDDILSVLLDDYLHIVRVQSRTVDTWNESLLQCITHIIGLFVACCCFNTTVKPRLTVLFSNETIVCDHLDELFHIMSHQTYDAIIENVERNDAMLLIDSIIVVILLITRVHAISWFIQSKPNVREWLMRIAERARSEKVSLRAYVALGSILTNEQLKELNVADRMVLFFFKILEEAWNHPNKKYQRIPIQYLLTGESLAKATDTHIEYL